jgi:hypothetical protein
MAGYSGTALVKKLAIKPSYLVALIHAPDGFQDTLKPHPENVSFRTDLRGRSAFDVIVWFVPDSSALSRRFGEIADRLKPSGGLWVAWPKKASGVVTDLNEAVVRQTGLEVGLVDNKVCAIDEVWSGLRFVVRLIDRG